MNREELIAQMAELQKQVRELDGKGESEIPVEVTVAMVVASDVAPGAEQYPIVYLGQTFYALEPGAQTVPINILVCPVDPDRDGANAWLHGIIKDKKWPTTRFKSFKMVGPIRSHGDANKNIEHALKLLCEAVTTEFVMFVEPDTEPQKGVVFDLLAMLKEDKEIGIVGAQYEHSVDHVKLGCSMMRTEIAKDINWRSDNGCVCRWLCHNELKSRGLKAVHLQKTHRARHLRNEM